MALCRRRIPPGVALASSGCGAVRERHKIYIGWGAIIASSLLAAAVAYRWAEGTGYERLDAKAVQQLELYTVGLDSELRRFENVPGLVELDGTIFDLLKPAELTAAAREQANAALARLAVQTGVHRVFILTPDGTAIAASDWYLPSSVVGQTFAQSRFFRQALQSGFGGALSTSPDRKNSVYHFAKALRRDGHIAGVAVAQVTLDTLESAWAEATTLASSDQILVLDENGVIVLGSVPQWKYRVLNAWTEERDDAPIGPDTYPEKATLQPLSMSVRKRLPHNALLATLPAVRQGAPRTASFLQEKPALRTGWTMVHLSDSSPVTATAAAFATAAAGITWVVGMFALYLLQQRRRVAERLASREALQRAHDELEQRVADRTSELRHANEELVREVAERQRTEATLRDAQDDLVQAGKLALLGQLSAGITHELNQPLTAQRALAENARLLLKRGRTEEVDKNLASIRDLTERMGRITTQLKTFARKAPAANEPVLLARAVANALLLMESRTHAERVLIDVKVSDTLRAWCDANRLEQVLVNLFANALDAMRNTGRDRLLTVVALESGERVLVRVTDNGVGIAPAARDRLFEPFFTTKPSGEGLGLGLMISASIVGQFGGSLQARESEQGAVFEFDLLRA